MLCQPAKRLLAVVACAAIVLVVPPPTPAAACTCAGDAIQTAELVGPPDVVFTGLIVDGEPSAAPEPDVVFEDPAQSTESLEESGTSLRLLLGLVGVTVLAMVGGLRWAKRGA